MKKGVQVWNKGISCVHEIGVSRFCKACKSIYDRKYNQSPKARYGNYRRNAEIRGLVLEISFSDFCKIITDKCHYCGEDGGGVDRVDNTLGYLKENVIACCGQCNRMKNNYTLEQFLDKCQKIVDNIVNKK